MCSKGSHGNQEGSCQCDPRLGDGCGAEGQFRSPRHADGHGGHCRGSVESPSSPQSGQPQMGRPRPLRAVQRPRLDVVVCAAASHRLSVADGRDPAFPAVAFDDSRPSRVRHGPGSGDHHRPSWPGACQCGGHGHRGKAARGRIQPSGPRHRRSPDLCLRRRRLPDGRYLARSLFACRHAGPGQADRDLRRQRYFHRRPRQRLVPR